MSKREVILVLVLIGISFVLPYSSAQANVKPAAGTKPHIVMMLVDDWGWANVGYHRDPPTKEVVTPNIDSLVREGLELDQHYVFQVCSPSRSSLISGRLPIHVNDLNIDPDWYNPMDPVSGFSAIPRNMTGIGTKMKEAGYVTHQVGKWDAGMATKDHTPLGRGFDSSFGYFHHANDYYTKGIGMRVSLTYGKLTIQQQERMEQPMKKVSLRNTCLMWSTTMIPPSHCSYTMPLILYMHHCKFLRSI